MRRLLIPVFALVCITAQGQTPTEQEIESKVNEVTVFLDGAQIERKKTVTLPKGESTIRFINLSPFINEKSLQVKASNNLPILAINHQKNYDKQSKKSEAMKALDKKLNTVLDNINKEENALRVIKYEIEFLQANKNIGGKNDQLNVANMQQTLDFYGKRLTELMASDLVHQKNITDLRDQENKIHKQIRTVAGQKEYPTGEIVIKVDAAHAGAYQFNLTYLVSNAGWFPSYDLRATNISQPLQLSYKANLRQDTQVDWTNVKIRFSTADPKTSNVAPVLKTYSLGYNMLPPIYKSIGNNISGRVMDKEGEPLVGATVVVTGTSIGASTDLEGKYSLTIPSSASSLTFSYIGYLKENRQINSETINVTLQEDSSQLDEVVVTGYSNEIELIDEEFMDYEPVDSEIATKRNPSSNKKSESLSKSNNSVSAQPYERQTAVYFEIAKPYTIKSGNKSYALEMTNYEMPATFQYYAVPKINKDAFLMAKVVDWEKYNLLDGEASIFFENTYVGKMVLDTRTASDTLSLSLGQDKKVSINRERTKSFTDKQFIGSKKEETRIWKTSIKNNKSESINIIVCDQIPVSNNEDIEVIAKGITGKTNAETGEVRWNLTLAPSESKQLELNYSVKYPKNRSLVIE